MRLMRPSFATTPTFYVPFDLYPFWSPISLVPRITGLAKTLCMDFWLPTKRTRFRHSVTLIYEVSMTLRLNTTDCQQF